MIGRSATTRSTVLLLLVLSACSGRAEQHLLRAYFDTCAAADDVALANTALVVLDPKRDGVVGHFRVLRVDPVARHPAFANARAARLSLYDPQHSHADSGAVLETKDVHVSAWLHRAGTATEAPLEVTLARARTADVAGRWIVVRLVLDGRTLPEASSDRP